MAKGRKHEPISEDRVYWGVLIEGDTVPAVLVDNRKAAEALMQLLPQLQKAKVQLVRTYVTVWVLGGKRGRPLARVPRDNNKH